MAVRANQLVNYKGDPYVTRPDLEEYVAGSIAIKPFTFGIQSMTDDGEGTLSIVVPGIVFIMSETATGTVVGDLEYLGGDDAGKTLVTFEDWDSVAEGFGENPSFVAIAFVKADGSPVTVLSSEPL